MHFISLFSKFLAKSILLKKVYYFFRKEKQPSISRKEANLFLREECKNITGDVLHVGSRSDYDKMGKFYKWYFKKCKNYKTLDIEGNVDFIQDITNMKDLKDNTFDAILCTWVLEHIKSVDDAITEIVRILKPGGTFFFSVPTTLGFHGYPHDYWRYRGQDIFLLLKDLTIIKLHSVGTIKIVKDIKQIDKKLKWYYSSKNEPSTQPDGWVGIAIKNL